MVKERPILKGLFINKSKQEVTKVIVLRKKIYKNVEVVTSKLHIQNVRNVIKYGFSSSNVYDCRMYSVI